jgi:hypothetical protein
MPPPAGVVGDPVGVRDRRAWLCQLAEGTGPLGEAAAARVLGGIACAVAARTGVRLPDLALLSAWGTPVPVPVPVVADAWLLGEALEVLLDPRDRRRRGVHHTARSVARAVAGLVVGRDHPATTTVCDPAVGGGAFLLAAADVLVAGGATRRDAVGRLTGVDVDPLAAAVTEAALSLWAGGGPGGTVVVADALRRPRADWGEPTAVLGNPPYLGQLRTATARRPGAAPLHPSLADVAGPYTDTAALFAALATDVVAPGGRVALVLPRSFLVARDAGAARQATLRSATLEQVWLPGERVFDAAVDVCVPVWCRGPADPARRRVRTGRRAGLVTRTTGVPPRAAPPCPDVGTDAGRGSWSRLLAGLDGDPAVPGLDGLRSCGVLGDLCSASAGFRDQFYGLIPFVVDDTDRSLDDADHPRLLTSGSIDPAASTWGARRTRYAGRLWVAPRVDGAAVDAAGGALARWVAGKRVPKLLVAAQTRTIEAVADVDGTWLPSTPVATLVPPADRLWHVLAVLLSPVATAWAAQHLGGSALNERSLRLPPASLRSLPTPAGREAWDRAADAVRSASAATAVDRRGEDLLRAARAMCEAYGVDAASTTAWWAARLPQRARPSG